MNAVDATSMQNLPGPMTAETKKNELRRRLSQQRNLVRYLL